MKIIIEISTGNAAFHNEHDESDRPEAGEVNRILQEVIDNRFNRHGLIEASFVEGPLRDINGNTCGQVKIEQ